MAKELWSLAAVVGVALLAQSGFRHLSENRDAERMVALARQGDIRMISSRPALGALWPGAGCRPRACPLRCLIEHATPRAPTKFRARGAAGTPLLVVRSHTVLGFDRGEVLKS